MATLLELAKRLEKQAASLGGQASNAAVRAAEAILKDLVYMTPVDTSKALSNWQVSLGAPADNSRPPYFTGSGGSTADKSAAAAIKAGMNVLKDKPPGVSIFLTNNLPYIRRLNEGYSKQAPAGFVERAVLIGRKIAEDIKIT